MLHLWFLCSLCHLLFYLLLTLKDEVETNLRNPFIKSVENFDAQINQLTRTSQIELNDILRTVDIKEKTI